MYWPILFNCCSYCTIFNCIAELVTPIGIIRKEANEEIEIHPLITETEIRKRSV